MAAKFVTQAGQHLVGEVGRPSYAALGGEANGGVPVGTDGAVQILSGDDPVVEDAMAVPKEW